LRGIATACIDVSDGLLADLGHACGASGVGARVDVDALPSSDALRTAFDAERRRLLQAAGGDDYELCFTAPADAREAVPRAAASAGVPVVSRIGRIVEGAGVLAFAADGQAWSPSAAGWQHFA
jgi:thiamine-monophosphate kinase